MKQNSKSEGTKIILTAKQILLVLSVLPLMILNVFLQGIAFRANFYLLIQNIILVSILGLVLVLLLFLGILKKLFPHENDKYIRRFVFAFYSGILFSMIFSRIPASAWILMILFIVYSFLSDAYVGFWAGVCTLFMTACFTSYLTTNYMLVYLICGGLGIAVFYHISDFEHVSAQITIVSLIQLMVLMLAQLINNNRQMTIEDFVIPVTNCVVNIIIILLYVQYHNKFIVKPIINYYDLINDPEYQVMLEMKERDKDQYFRCIHTAYLVERLSRVLELDTKAAKCASYYYRLPASKLSEMEIPEPALKVITELKNTKNTILCKEAVVVYICDTTITSIRYLHAQMPQLDYEAVIKKLFEKMLSPETFYYSQITLRDMDLIRNKLLEEKMYYEFLCRD